jgi:hypothetical protein
MEKTASQQQWPTITDGNSRASASCTRKTSANITTQKVGGFSIRIQLSMNVR